MHPCEKIKKNRDTISIPTVRTQKKIKKKTGPLFEVTESIIDIDTMNHNTLK